MFSKSRLTSDDYENGREHRNHMSGSRDSPTYVHQVQTQTAQPVRLPQIQLPHPERDLYHTVRQPISTNPSLHHYKSGDSGGHSTQTLLREFFSRPDDCTSPPIDREMAIAETQRGSEGVGYAGNSSRYEAMDHSPRIYQQSRNNANVVPVSVAPEGNNISRRLSVTESSTFSGAEESDNGRDSFRCSDCNRKCKSMASYMKHKSLMCTHRMGFVRGLTPTPVTFKDMKWSAEDLEPNFSGISTCLISKNVSNINHSQL
ncbi:hypothetical protein BY996DRAFT_6413356 [Phakopsora pachyrhizi]|nr:hypothetical protein BY996DRAFT_6413356 [Phakopsora pachyrhizi]